MLTQIGFDNKSSVLSFSGKTCAGFARHPGRWLHTRPSGPWRIASPICAGLILR